MGRNTKVGKSLEELSRFKSMIEASGEEVYLVRPDGELVYVNEAAARSLGYTVQEMLKMGVAGFSPLSGSRFSSHFEDVKKGNPLPVETYHIAKDGSKVFKEIKFVYLNMEGTEYVCGFGRNITDRKRIEDELRRNEKKLRSIFSAAPTGIGLVSNRVIMEANERLCEMTGYRKEELIGQNARIVYLTDEDYEFVGTEKYRQIGQKGTGTVETRWKTKGGDIIDIILSSTPLDPANLSMGVTFTALDITERKRVDKQLAFERAQLLSIFEGIDEAAYVADPNTYEILYANRHLRDLFGKDIVGRTCYEEFQGLEQPCEFCTNPIITKNRGQPYKWIYHNPTLNRDYEIVDRIIQWPDGRDVRFEFAVDITEHKRMEEALRQSEREKDLIVNSVSEVVIFHDTSLKVLWANRAARESAGMSAAELTGQHCYEIWHGGNRMCDGCPVEGVLNDGAKHQCEVKSPDGRWWLISASPVHDEMDRIIGAVEVGRDITERKHAEEERIEMERRLLHAQKLESLGVLAGGIAHDFNNLLMAILGNLDLALAPGSDVPAMQSNIEQAIQATYRATDLTRQMLAYSGKGRFIVSTVDLNELVRDNVHLFRASISKNTTLNLRFDSVPPFIDADAGEIQQIVMNLITNASEAIGEEVGEITISTSIIDCTDEHLARSRIEEKPDSGRFVCLEVADTGCGMDQDIQDRLFDPFFTTKFTGRGLGMCAVLGIVRGHKGALLIDSTVGKGTTVQVLFPAAAEVPEAVKQGNDVIPEDVLEEKPFTPVATVLLADDEAMVRKVCASILQKLGFKVISAEDGLQAVEIFRKHAGEIDCVILDLSMPKMNGLAAFQEMLVIEPDVKVILVSGYSEQDATRRYSAKGLAGFIQKPYRLQALQKNLSRILANRR